MARFLPYDQTGFGRFDARPFREAYGSRAKWMRPQELAKPQDWSRPENLAKLLQLSSALVQNPVVDLAVKGVGEVVKATKDKPVAPGAESEVERLTNKAAQARAYADKMETFMGEGPVVSSDGTTQVPSEGDMAGFREEQEAEFKRRGDLASGLEREASDFKSRSRLKSADDLFAMVVAPGADREQLRFALKVASRFAGAPTLSQMRTGKDPANDLRKQLIAAYMKKSGTELTQFQEGRLSAKREERLARAFVNKEKMDLASDKNAAYINKAKAQVDHLYKKGLLTDTRTKNIIDMMMLRRTKQTMATVRLYYKSLPKDDEGLLKRALIDRTFEYLNEKDFLKGIGVPKDRVGGGKRNRNNRNKNKNNGPNSADGDGDDDGGFDRYKTEFDTFAELIGGDPTKDELISARSKIKSYMKTLGGSAATAKPGKGGVRKGTKKVFLDTKRGKLAESLYARGAGLLERIRNFEAARVVTATRKKRVSRIRTLYEAGGFSAKLGPLTLSRSKLGVWSLGAVGEKLGRRADNSTSQGHRKAKDIMAILKLLNK
tara:strand:+ start:15935 stop:17575 length:1641 start_codon:yes stop_codon:yes gene_type:complete